MERAYKTGKGRATVKNEAAAEQSQEMLGDALEEVAREGARRLLAEALELEVNEFLQRARYQRGRSFRGYRNVYAAERTVGVGLEQ